MGLFQVRNYLSSSSQRRAFQKYEDVASTKKGQKLILEKAKNGDVDAINYIFIRSERILGKLFHNNYITDKKNTEQAWDQFLDLAYRLLVSTSLIRKDPSIKQTPGWNQVSNGPLNVFNPDVFDKDPNVDLIDKFGWYYQQIMRTNISAERRWAKKATSEEQTYSLDTPNSITGKTQDYDSGYSVEDDFLKKDDLKKTLKIWKEFCQDDDLHTGGKYPLSKIIKEGLLSGDSFSKKDIMRKTGISFNFLEKRIEQMKKLFDIYGLEYEDFKRLIDHYGYEKLSSYL